MHELYEQYNQYAQELRQFYGDLKKAREIGREIRALPRLAAYKDWDGSHYPLGMILAEYVFDSPWSQENLQNRHLETYFADIALSNEWGMDVYELLTDEERQKTLDYMLSPWERQGYQRLKVWSSEDFCEEFADYAKCNEYTEEETADYLSAFKDAFIFEIGGSYVGDHDFFVLSKEGRAFSISFGIWD